MYAYLKGVVAIKEDESIVIDVNDIGYRVYMPKSDIIKCENGSRVTVYTYTCVREDAFMLYGFVSQSDLELFKMLITVSGIGPKMGLSILSSSDADSIKMAIATQDSKLLSSAPGIGAKTANRIILELKDKITASDLLGAINNEINADQNSKALMLRSEAMDAMVENFGFAPPSVAKALNQIDINDESKIEDIIRQLLGILGSGI